MKANLVEFDGPAHFERVWSLQKELREKLPEGGPQTLIICQHEPVITLGKNGDEAGIVVSPEILRQKGVEVFRIERGGQATVHSPGQLVTYPILNLRLLGLSPKKYVNLLEEWMISTARDVGITAERVAGKPGVYTGNGKLGALGVSIRGGMTMHGIALNVENDLSLFDLILPCGESDIRPVSLKSEGARAEMSEVSSSLKRNFERTFDLELT